VHLYLAQVLETVLSHKPSVYANYYTVPRLLTPYCLQYYVLSALTKFVSAVTAERLFVAGIVALQCFGFRYLAIGIGPSGALYSLFIVGTVLNWPLLMGFQSYALAVALACWALGFWVRANRAEKRPWPLYAAFVACSCLVLLTHPLPYLLIIAVCGIDLAAAAITARGADSGVWVQWRRQAIACAAACVPLLFLWSFSRTHRTMPSAQQTSYAERLRYFLGLHGLSFFGGGGIAVRLYQAATLFALTLGLVVAARAILRAPRRWTPAHTWLLATLLLAVLLVALPDGFGGSRAVVLRLQPLLWIGALAAASTAPWPRRGRFGDTATLLALIAVACALTTFGLSIARITPVARRIAAANAIPATDSPGRRGLILTTGPSAESDLASLLYGPYYWQGVSYFRRTHSVLLNTPWMDSTWLPVQPRAEAAPYTGLLIHDVDPDAVEFYWHLRTLLSQSPTLRARVLAHTDFVLFTDQDHTATQPDLDAVLDTATYHWSCQRHDWYILCDKQGTP
ncbi:MAG: hypothetical protein QOH85_1881, partial [Acidobacteriaceae bacterium]|nr:hypothetical protein [Acidobacteriaceae bacterium]